MAEWAAPYLPTPHEIVKKMLKIARVEPGDIVYDLGCGDGRILIAAVKDFGAERAVGYEINWELCRTALTEVKRHNLQNKVKIVNGGLFDADIRDATVITAYLNETMNQRLKLKLERTARAGTKIVSYVYEIRGWKPAKRVRVKGAATIYLYTIKCRGKGVLAYASSRNL